MPVNAICLHCERGITLSVEGSDIWIESSGNLRCGDGSHIGHPHVPRGSTIERDNDGAKIRTANTDTNLNALTEANKEMNEAERSEFDNFFIGVLSCKVSRQEWDDAIRTALRCCADRCATRPLR